MAPRLLESMFTRSSLTASGELRDALSAAVLDASGCCGLVEPATLGKSMTCNL